jgi:predicted nucleotidyltransferase
MNIQEELRKWANQLALRFSPEKVILFGSYAYGQPTADSDVDLLVVMAHTESDIKKASEIRMTLPVTIPIDVIVRSPKKIQERLLMGDFFIREIMEKGKILYAASHA